MQWLEIKVKTNARESSLEENGDGTWRASLKAAPVDGKANAELIKLLAKSLQVRKGQVVIKTGVTSRLKRVQILDT
jgi:uncharacterized protein